MVKTLLIALGFMAASIFAVEAQSDQANRDRASAEVHGSYKPSSNESVMTKLASGNCGALAAGGTASTLSTACCRA